MSAKRSHFDPKSFFKDLENTASDYQIRAITLADPDQNPLGIILLRQGITPKEALDALRDYTSSSASAIGTQNDSEECASEGAEVGSWASVPDSKHFDTLLATELDRVHRTRLPCALMRIALDGSSSNCGDGAHLDDIAFRHASAAIKDNLHPVDIVARYGPRSFVIVLPGTHLGKARTVAEQLRKAVKSKPLSLCDSKECIQTISIGIAVFHSHDPFDPETFREIADDQLQRAKSLGGDRVCHVSGSRHADTCQVTQEEKAQLLMIAK